MSTPKDAPCQPETSPESTPAPTVPQRPTLAYEPSLRWLGRWVPGYFDY